MYKHDTLGLLTSQYDLMLNLKINLMLNLKIKVGHCDIYFMVQWLVS